MIAIPTLKVAINISAWILLCFLEADASTHNGMMPVACILTKQSIRNILYHQELATNSF